MSTITSYNAIDSNQQFRDTPLFGPPTYWDKFSNVITAGLTLLFVVITLLGAFINTPSESGPSKGVNIFLAICITVFCLTHELLVYWYRQGDVDPKFRFLIYSNTVVIFSLCICAHLYIYA